MEFFYKGDDVMKNNSIQNEIDEGDDVSQCRGCPFMASCCGRPSIKPVMKSDGKHVERYRQTEIERLLFSESDSLNIDDHGRFPVGVDDIVFMLDEKGKRHADGYFLYTTVAAMRGIFSNRKLHLTRASEMNDQLEFVRFDKERWQRIYMACFSYDKNESMGMWRMYGGEPEESVRLKFSRKGLVEHLEIWKNNLPTMLFKAERGGDGAFFYSPLQDVKACISLHDILYQHVGRKGSSFVHYQGMYSGPRRAVVFQDPRKCRKLTSYVKDAIWEYEREVRLVLEVEETLPKDCTSLALDIGDLLNDVSVLLGPHESKATRVMEIFTNADVESEGKIDISPAKVRFRTSGVK